MARVQTIALRRMERLRRRKEKKQTGRIYCRSSLVFRFDASLRIGGAGAHHAEISRRTGLQATKALLKGHPVRPNSKRICQEDIWILSSPLSEYAAPGEHLAWLWEAVAPHIDYFSELIPQAAWADICIGCLSESPFPLISIDPSSLELMRRLKIGVSFNFTCT
ncbi:DUF4279 domain-containing protein [Massilia sp. W12]|uniref:DUF4279 domain-containing protein n=1 Tax=Massilia sp. W12 TaxID=3126507 RepID=UPI0030CB0618